MRYPEPGETVSDFKPHDESLCVGVRSNVFIPDFELIGTGTINVTFVEEVDKLWNNIAEAFYVDIPLIVEAKE